MRSDETTGPTNGRVDPKDWKYPSPSEPGWHAVVSPANSVCKVTSAFRLNLPKDERYTLSDDRLEINGVVIEGSVSISHDEDRRQLGKFDSFYLPAGESLEIEAIDEAILYLGGGPYEGTGGFFVRAYDSDMPKGEIRQTHGAPPYQRDVFMTLNQETPASRMINGITWGAPGMWTSWPPHQHSEDLEEVYCYFDIPDDSFALHLSSRFPGEIEAVHPVRSGDFVIIPEGYHPTVGAPGTRSSYFWIMVAHHHSSRSYQLAKTDFTPLRD